MKLKFTTSNLLPKINTYDLNKIILSTFFLIIFSAKLSSQNYPAEILNYDIVCKVDADENLGINESLLIKINSPAGRKHAEILLSYSGRSTIEEIQVDLLNTNRELIKSLKEKEIEDHVAYTGYFHTDNRYKQIKAHHNEYPYLIELKYKRNYNQFFWLPFWYPQYGKRLPLKKSSYSLTVPIDYTFHHKIYNFEPKELVQKDAVSTTYLWEVENISPMVYEEPFSTSLERTYPTARFVPDHFVFGGIEGSTDSWKEVGNWQSKLIKGLDILPQGEVEKVRELTKGAATDYEKVKILYTYLQKETRYVNVSIGIGGWKPYDASYVVENKYGDCKALTNYMKAMLKAVGIESYYSLIMAGKDEPDIDTSLPGMNFNHVVLYVPLQNDKIWLECTSQTNAFNYWSTFTNGKHALVCDFEDSYITQTPQFTNAENAIYQTSEVHFEDGKLVVDLQREMLGEEYENAHSLLKKKSDQDINQVDYDIFPFTNCSVNEIKYFASTTKNSHSITENSKLIFKNHTQEFGSNMIVKPFSSYLKVENTLGDYRINPIEIMYNYKITDVVNYHIPEGYQTEPLPDDHFDSRFGECTISSVEQNGQLKVTKQFELYKGIYSATDYAAFKSFMVKLTSVENQKILLKKL